MEAEIYSLKTLLGKHNDIQYYAPPYQREYSWKKEQWQALWDDVQSLEGQHTHFIGAIVVLEPEKDSKADLTRYAILDGQQRFITLFIFLAALRPLIKTESLQKKVKSIFVNFEAKGDDIIKMLPTARNDDRTHCFAERKEC
jgi:uncharacterized protein with ParB-like and HNH nuclease domain